MNYYSYILVRRDMPPSVQVVQASHAAMETGFKCPAPPTPTHFVVLGVSGEKELQFYAEYLKAHGIRCEMFFEPDYGWGNTALCTHPIKGKIKELNHLTLL